MKRTLLLVSFSALLITSGIAVPAEESGKDRIDKRGVPVTIMVIPTAAVVSTGTTFDVDIDVSGLGAFASPSVGSYDLVLTFDPAILTYNGITYGSDLGASVTVDDMPSAAEVGSFEVSLLSVMDLNAAQPDAFTFYTLNFTAMTVGTSPLSISVTALGDENGRSLAAQVINAQVDVNPQVLQEIPTLSEWGLLLLMSGLVGYALLRVRRARR